MPNTQYDVREVAKHAMNAINSSDIADAEIPPLADAAAFLALFTGRASGHWNQRRDMEFHHESIRAAIGIGIITDADVSGGSTLNDVRDAVIADAATAGITLARTYQSGNRHWQ